MATEKIAIAPEGTPGVNPGSGFIYYPFTSADLGEELTRIRSNELRPDRNPARSALVGKRTTRGFNFDMHLELYNPLLEGLYDADFSTLIDLDTQAINITGAAGNTATLTDVAPATAFANASVGQWLKLGGFTNPLNNTWVRITAKASDNSVTVEGTAFADESGQTDITVKGTMLRVGAVGKTFSIEKQAPDSDATGLFELGLGNIINTMNLTVETGSLLNGSLTVLGRTMASTGTTAAGTPAAAAERDILGPITGIEAIREGTFETDSGLRVSGVGFTWNNNAEAEEELGTLGATAARANPAQIDGRLRVYRNSTGIVALKQKAENDTASKLSYRLVDSDGNAMIFTYPYIKFNEVPTPVPGNTGPRVADATFTAEPDDTGVAAQVDWFPAA